MNLTRKTWECENAAAQIVVQVDFTQAEIRQAQHVADQKMQYTNEHNPGGIQRSPEIIRNRITAGKLADAAVLELLMKAVARRNLPWQIKEYDQIRTDGFRNPDQYDLLITDGQNRSAEIEIRSSFSYRLLPQDKIVKKLSTYGWYTSANKAVEGHHDWYWQVVYYLRPRDIPRDPKWPLVDVFEDCLDAGAVTGFIVGGACKAMLEDTSQSCERSDQDGARYRAIHPICNSLDCQEMLDAMFGTIPRQCI